MINYDIYFLKYLSENQFHLPLLLLIGYDGF